MNRSIASRSGRPRWLRLLGFAFGLALTGAPASSNDGRTIEFDATSGTPIADVEIGEETVRFALDPLLGPFITVNPEARERIAVNSVREDGISAEIDGAEIKGSLAKVKLAYGRRSHTVEAALINRNHLPAGQSEPYDVAGGFEALPAHFIVVHLNRDMIVPTREITFSRRRGDPRPGFPIGIADVDMRINVHFANSTTWLDRSAAQALMDQGLLEPTGEVSRIPVWYGLQMPVQRMKPVKRLVIRGLPLDDLQARTDDALVLPEPDENVIIVQRSQIGGRQPSILLGLDTLRHCAKMVFDQRKRRLTFTCPA